MLSLWTSLNNVGKAILLIFFSIVVIVLSEIGAASLLRQGMDIVLTPATAIFSRTTDSILGVGRFVGSIGSMAEENHLLREKVELLEAEQADLLEVKRENQILREQLNLQEDTGLELVSARVIAREPLGTAKTITIEGGENRGFTPRMAVVVSEGLLVGYIEEVLPRSSKVILLSDVSVEIPARLQKSRADGIVKGQAFGQGLVMELIPQEALVEHGNTVVTSGLNDEFPPGLLIGYVQTVYQDPNDIFQRSDILPAVDFDRLERVAVVKGGGEPS